MARERLEELHALIDERKWCKVLFSRAVNERLGPSECRKECAAQYEERFEDQSIDIVPFCLCWTRLANEWTFNA